MLAIVIPYYKLTFFEQTLNSLANQTNIQFKVYIGDDASPENSLELLERYNSKFEFIYHRFETNLGSLSLVKQWERCLKLINDEEWVMILGDDDVLEKDCVDSFYQNLVEVEKLESTVIRFSSSVIDSKGNFISNKYTHPKTEFAADFLFRKLKGGTRSSLSEYIFKKKSIQDIKFKDFPLAWNTDLLAVLEFSNWQTIYTINEAQVYFRLSEFNITNKKDNIIIKNNATFQFYNYLLSKKGLKLSKELVSMLFDRLEKTLLDNKKEIRHWLLITKLYVVKAQFKRYLNLIKKAIIMIVKKIKDE